MGDDLVAMAGIISVRFFFAYIVFRVKIGHSLKMLTLKEDICKKRTKNDPKTMLKLTCFNYR